MYFIHVGIGCSEEHAAEVAHARYEEKKLDEHRTRVGRTVESPIVLSDGREEDEDDTEDDDDAFFTQAVEAADEAEAA